VTRYACHLFVCLNERKPDDPRGCCSAKGSAAILDALKAKAHAAGLKGKVRVNKAGCLDACEHGVSIVCYPHDIWYAHVTLADVDEIVERTLLRGERVARVLARPGAPTPAAAPPAPAAPGQPKAR
jgi:(2Fe-2S) ferredoxin